MGTRTERLRAAQVEMERRPVPPRMTRATEDRVLVRRPRMGIITYLCIGLAALGVVWALSGLASAGDAALRLGLCMAIFWGLLAWANEVLRDRARRRGEG